MRLFVAIELDDPARRAIAAEQNRLREAFGEHERSALKWVRPVDMHLTLVFLGELSQDRGETVVEVMGTPVPGARFAITFGGLGVFPPRGAPQVLWLGLSRGGQQVIALQRQVVERLVGVGMALEDRVFHPHLTLARWRGGRSASTRSAEVHKLRRDPSTAHRALRPRDGGQSDRQRALTVSRRDDVAQMEVAAVTLVQSRLSQGGPMYSPLCRAQLEEDRRPPLQSVS